MSCGLDEDDWTAIDFLLFLDETEEERRARLASGARRPAPPPAPPPPAPPATPPASPAPSGFRPPPPPDAPRS